jgi:probable phosphoglycerate mutase
MSRVSPGNAPTRRRIYLLRHGEADYFSPEGKPFAAHAVPLNDDGKRQASAAAEALAPVPLDRAITSPLRRSRETAEIILADRCVPIEQAPELTEIAGGKLGEIAEEAREASFVDAFGTGITRRTKFLGGERFGDFVDRVVPRFAAIVEEPGWNELLLVLHGAVNRAILGHVLGYGLRGFGAIEQDAGCINIVDVDGGRAVVRLVNHTPYNPLKEGLRRTVMEALYGKYRPD